MGSSTFKRGKFLVLAITLVSVVMAASGANGQPIATPRADCVRVGGSPVVSDTSVGADRNATPPAGTPEVGTPGSAISDTADLVETLEGCGLNVEPSPGVEQPFLEPESGSVLHLSGGGLLRPADLQVFEYKDAASADMDAEQIGPDGQPPTMMISWIEPPHFFRGERLIVLYLGEDQAVIDVLTTLMGPPFAGN